MQTSKNARPVGPRWHKRVVIGLAAAGLILSGVGMSALNAGAVAPAKADTVLPYQDVSLSPAVRAADLVSRMTLQEKQAQLVASNPNFGGQAPAIPRLGVGAYSYWNEALHGVARDGGTPPDTTNMDSATKALLGVATEFPTGLGIASSWDTQLVRQESNVIAQEARAYWSDPQVNDTKVVANSYGTVTTYQNRRYGLTFWSPTVNLDRDPRWGRAEETYGEDPYLTGQIGTQFVKGVQQGDTTVANPKNYLAAVATTKHFFANNSEVNRHTGSADMTDSELRDYYTRQFRQLTTPVSEGGAGAMSLMTAYSAVNGTPMPANSFADTTLLRRTWGFTGFVTSDCAAVENVFGGGSNGGQGHDWAPAQLGRQITRTEATAWSLKAGTDVDCATGSSNAYYTDTINAIAAGLMTENDLNINLDRMFEVRIETGEFDPSTPWDGYTIAKDVDTQASRNVAIQASEEAPVLLVNKNNTLPLTKADDSKVAMVGEFADAIEHGDYSPTLVAPSLQNVTPFDAMKDYLGDANVTADNGVGIASKPQLGSIVFEDASGKALGTYQISTDDADAVTDLQGYNAPSTWFNVIQLGLTPVQDGTLKGSFTVKTAIPAGTAKIALATAGTPTVPTDGSAYGFDISIDGTDIVAAPVEANGPGNCYGSTCWAGAAGAASDVTLPAGTVTDATTTSVPGSFGAAASLNVTGGTKVALHFNYVNDAFVGIGIGSTDPAAAQINTDIKAAKVVLVQVGTKSSDAGEENDPSTISLPREQGQLAAAACTAAHEQGKKCVVYVQAISLAALNPFYNTGTEADADAIIWATYNGEAQGYVVPRILYGDANPSGHLPFTYYHSHDGNTLDGVLAPTTDYQLTPTYSDQTQLKENGRTYQYFDGQYGVDFPFGFGLSYSTFKYSNLKLNGSVDKPTISPNDTLSASVNVTNTSKVAGQAVVEAYVVPPTAADATTPNEQLKGFQKVQLAAGQTKTVTIPVDASDLWFWDTATGKEAFEQGTWGIEVGNAATLTDSAITSTMVQLETQSLSAKFQLRGSLKPAIQTVAAIPDGSVLNTKTPDDVIHANLSAALNDQSFLDLADPAVGVAYKSSDPAVATVDATGAVKAGAKAGTATITAAVSYLGQTKTSSFAVVTYDGQYTTAYNDAKTTLFGGLLDFGDQTVALADASSDQGIALKAAKVEAGDGLTVSYDIAPMDQNDANAQVTPDGVLTASQAGAVRVTAVATNADNSIVVAQTATITVTSLDTAAATATIKAAQAVDLAGYTPASVAALNAAVAAAQAVIANPAVTQAQIDAANAQVTAAQKALVKKGDTAPLNNVAAAGKVLAGLTGYTPATSAALAAALAVAAQVAANPNASAAEVQAATEGVLKAIGALKVVQTLTSTRPTIKGTVKTGKTVTAVTGTWTAGAKLKVTWYVNHKKVKTAAKLTLKKAYKGKKLVVKVTGTKAGYTTVTRASKTVKIK